MAAVGIDFEIFVGAGNHEGCLVKTDIGMSAKDVFLGFFIPGVVLIAIWFFGLIFAYGSTKYKA